MLPSGQRRDKHDERALREMEVRDQGVDAAEAVSRIDEDIRPAGGGMKQPVLVRKALQRAAGGGAHGDDPAAVLPAAVHDRGGFLRDDAELRVHLVILDLVLLDGAEGAEPDVQRDRADGDAH